MNLGRGDWCQQYIRTRSTCPEILILQAGWVHRPAACTRTDKWVGFWCPCPSQAQVSPQAFDFLCLGKWCGVGSCALCCVCLAWSYCRLSGSGCPWALLYAYLGALLISRGIIHPKMSRMCECCPESGQMQTQQVTCTVGGSRASKLKGFR